MGMKYVVVVFFVFLFGVDNMLFCQSKEWVEYLNLQKKADSLYLVENYHEAKVIFSDMLLLQNNKLIGYDLQRYVYCFINVGDTIGVEPYLFELVQKKWFDYKIINEPFFQILHSQSYWYKIDSVAKRNDNKNYEMVDSLAKMGELDQKVRRVREAIRKDTILTQYEKDSVLRIPINSMFFVDSINVEKLKHLIALYGFPTWELVGKVGAKNAWLIAQHARPEFQEWYLEQYEQAVKEDNADIRYYAYLIDRVRSRKRIPQLYGTQWYSNGGFHPIEDVEHLNDRRENVLLDPLDISQMTILKEYKH